MSYRDEPRLRLVADILTKKRDSSKAFVQYMSTSREYGQGENLYMREAHFITAVEPGDGKIMSEIAEELSITHGAVSQIASRLEKKGYIIRKRDSSNHRQIIAVLTPKGEDFYQRHIQFDSTEFAMMDEQYLSRFTDEQLSFIRDYEALMCSIFTKKVNNSK